MTHRILPALALLLSCDGCDGPTDSARSQAAPGERVVVLVLDGVRLEESLGDGYSDVLGMETVEVLPKLGALVDAHGARITGAMAAGITITAPGHSDLLTGLHHAFANYPVDDDSGAYLPEVPSLLSVLPEGQAVLATNSRLVVPLIDSTSPLAIAPAEVIEGSADRYVLAKLQDRLTDSAVRLAVVNLHQADREGHSGPIGGYGEKVLDLDDAISSFWTWMQADPGWQDATLVLVADHGRHRRDDVAEAWREHGDDCTGCRQIPMALIGTAITPGAVVEGPHTLEDLGQTIAWLLGEPLPYGTGSVIDEALLTPSGEPGLTGAVVPAAAGDVLAWEERTGALDPRAVVVRDGVTISDPGAFAAEAPAAAADETSAALCWRELHIEGADTWPWLPSCQLRDAAGEWQDIGGPAEVVGSLWRPALALQGDTLLAGWVDNPSGVIVSSSSRLVLSRWAPGGWSELYAVSGGSFPADPALALDGTEALLAVALSEDGEPGRLSRRIDLHRIDTTTGSGGPVLSIRPAGAEEGGDHRLSVDRLEHPALWHGADGLRLAFISYTPGEEGRVRTDLWQSDDLGAPALLDTGLLGHVPPAFDEEGTLHWIRQQDGVASRCTEQGCVDLGTAAVRGLSVSGGSAWVSVLSEGRTWSLQAD